MQLRSKRRLESPELPNCDESDAGSDGPASPDDLPPSQKSSDAEPRQTEQASQVGPISRSRPSNADDAQAGSIIARIETIMEIVVDQLSQNTKLSIEFASRRSAARRSGHGRHQTVQFPGSRLSEAKKFARLLLILQLSHSALVSGIILTKRNLFYQHQELFESQRNVDDLVDDVALMLDTNRDALNITASPKGMIVGSILLELTDGTSLDMSACAEGTLIPMSRSIQVIDILSARWILVIEKDATFRSLASAGYWETGVAGRQGILVTAKGYPDLNTRTFLRLIRSKHPLIPIFVLTDFDPDGISIYSCYRYGSKALSHEIEANNIACSWLGVQMEHVIPLLATGAFTGVSSRSGPVVNSSLAFGLPTPASFVLFNEPCTYLSSRDRSFATKAMDRTFERGQDEDDVLKIRRQLQLMLMLGIKVEIQGLDEYGNLAGWLDQELARQLFHPTQ